MPTKSKAYAVEYNKCSETIKNTTTGTLEKMLIFAEVDLKVARNEYSRRQACRDAIEFKLRKGIPKRHKVR